MAEDIPTLNARRQSKMQAIEALYGLVDTETSFFQKPPTTRTEVKLFVFDSEESARQVAVRLLDELDHLQYHGTVIAVRTADLEQVEPILERGAKRGYRVIDRGEFDPRGQLLDNWTDEELRAYLAQQNIAPARSVKNKARAELLQLVRDDHYGNIGGGTTNEDPEDEVGERLLRIWNAVDRAKPVRGKVTAARSLLNGLNEHVDDGFTRGRKTRIAEFRKLIPMLDLKPATAEGMLAGLSEMSKL